MNERQQLNIRLNRVHRAELDALACKVGLRASDLAKFGVALLLRHGDALLTLPPSCIAQSLHIEEPPL
jgi:hypothetical protein